ncbi:MAG: hypothetical protein ACRD38_09350 [Nitrososphaerales archaeon]
MVKAEQIITDRKKLKEIIEFMEEALKEGLSKEEIMSQIDLMLDKEAQKRIKQSIKEIKQGKAKRFKSSRQAISWLHYQKMKS